MANYKLYGLDVDETSGVDRPAHLHDGFIVMKNTDNEATIKAQMLTALGISEEDNLSSVQEQIDTAVEKMSGDYENKVKGLEVELEAAKNQAADLAKKLEELMRSGHDESEKGMHPDEEMKQAMEEMKEMDEKMYKSVTDLPAEQQELFYKAFTAQADEIRKAQAEILKERDVRLDSEAIMKSRDTYKNIGIEHEVVAPALRRLTSMDADLAKAVENVLNATDAQLAEAGLLKEYGTATGSTPTVVEEAKAIAKGLLAEGVVKTLEQGVEKALDTNPALAKRYMEEVAR